MSTESDSSPDDALGDIEMPAIQPEVMRNLIKICNSYSFLDILKVHDMVQLKSLLLQLCMDLRNTKNENKLLYGVKDRLMIENQRLKMAAQAEVYYRGKINQLMTTNRDALLQLNDQQNKIVEMCTFLEKERERFANTYIDLAKQSRDMVKKLNEKIALLKEERNDLQAKFAREEERAAKLAEESIAMRQKCDEFLGEDAEKLSQIEGLQTRIESLLGDHQRIAQHMAESNRNLEAKIVELQEANGAQAQKLKASEDEIGALSEKLTAQNTVVVYQKKLMQDLTASKNELTSKLARLGDELTAKNKDCADLEMTLKSELEAKAKQLEDMLDQNKQLQASSKQLELEMSKNTENSNRKLAALQQELDAAGTQRSTDLASLQEQLDAKQAAIEKSSQADVHHQAEVKKLQGRIDKMSSKIQEKDKQIADLLKKMRNDRFGSINVVVPETDSLDGQPKDTSFSLLPQSLNLPSHDSIDDDFAFVSKIAMADDDDTDFESMDGRSTVNEPIPKTMRSSFPPMGNAEKSRGRKRKSKDAGDTESLSGSTRSTSFNFSGISSISNVHNFPKRMVTMPKPTNYAP